MLLLDHFGDRLNHLFTHVLHFLDALLLSHDHAVIGPVRVSSRSFALLAFDVSTIWHGFSPANLLRDLLDDWHRNFGALLLFNSAALLFYSVCTDFFVDISANWFARNFNGSVFTHFGELSMTFVLSDSLQIFILFVNK